MNKYPLNPTKNYYTADKCIYYFFNSKNYQVWKKKDGERIIIKNIRNINDARIIRGCIIRYFNSL